ncbi:MAG: YraN family protein [Firmicutes bacterium]|nr:YraN family protein [Bacillota bacterium]
MNIGITGESGEQLAVKHLQSEGYKITVRNYQSRFGEIDIICENDEYIVFAEVKTRASDALVSGRFAVTAAKQRRIIKTAMLYLQQNQSPLQPRFDVIEVSGKEGLNHIENAFDIGAFHGYI